MKIGLGYDVHKLVNGRKLIIGGVDIPYPKGLDGHSDADVLVHALMDAILGAAKLGDIGKLFPDNDTKWKDADSLELLKNVNSQILNNGYFIEDLDCVLIAQEPKFSPYILQMKKNIAAVLEIDIDKIGIKATTSEGLGYQGKGLGISSQAVVLLNKR